MCNPIIIFHENNNIINNIINNNNLPCDNSIEGVGLPILFPLTNSKRIQHHHSSITPIVMLQMNEPSCTTLE